MREKVFFFSLQNFVVLYVSNQNQLRFLGMPLLELLELPVTMFGLAIASGCGCRGGGPSNPHRSSAEGRCEDTLTINDVVFSSATVYEAYNIKTL